ncbi:MAG: SDR family oxidoreductase [Bacteroidia bacterium]|nr:SDR family oxidoreductase [Bacteroidia bacterium]
MNLSLTGKNALVCGSTQGIGRAIAHELAALGARVILLARNTSALEETLASLPPVGLPHAWLQADLADPEAAQATVQTWMERESAAIHILVNNAGGPPGGPIVSASLAAFQAAMDMHLGTSHRLVQTVVPGMRTAGYGRILNVISTSVRIPITGLGVSNTTRGAMASWAKTLANELGADGITVNNILPGFTETARLTSLIQSRATAAGLSEADIAREMQLSIPVGRFGTAGEIAAVAAFLATPAAAYVNGVSIPVDGGRTGSI